MNDLTLEALKKSITAWEGKVFQLENGKMPPLGTESCPLCRRFHMDMGCSRLEEACPVAAAIGEAFCQGTPYYKVADAKDENDLPRALDAARLELEFLKSLMPAEKADA